MSPRRELPRSIGRYGVVRELGSGAMGRVLLARDPVLERHVAIKVLRDDLDIAPDVREALVVRMRHEARAAARVTHPNLVVLHDMGEDPELGLYLVFEYLEGPTLKQALRELKVLKPRRAARLAAEIGSALSFAHERGVLHRDVKPENIILTSVGAKLADFGIARVPDSTLTHTGGLLGTPAYSAPETFRETRFSPKSDQFSLAATLYEAISGERAFPGDDALSVAHKITHEDPKPFAERRNIARDVDDVMLRALSKNPDDRYDTCDAFGAALVGALRRSATGAATSVAPPSEEARGEDGKVSLLPPLKVDGRPSDLPALLSPAPPEPGIRSGWLYVAVFASALVVVLVLLRFFLLPPRDAALDVPVDDDDAQVPTAEPTVVTSAKKPAVPTTLRPRLPDANGTASASPPATSASAPPSPSATATASSAAPPATSTAKPAATTAASARTQ